MALYLPCVALIDLAGGRSVRWYKNGTQAKIQGNMGILRGGQRCKMQKQRFLSQEGVFLIVFLIPGEPKGKARPRVVRLKNGASTSYTPDKTVAYEELVRQRFRQQWSSTELPFPNQIPVQVKITAWFTIPKSASKKARAAMLSGLISPTKKPDVDNVVKIILDALNGFAWHDDSQVVNLQIEKKYTQREPFVEVKMEPYTPR